MPRRASAPGQSDERHSGRDGDDLKLGLTLANTAHFPWSFQVDLVQTADRLGYETLWVSEAYSWDAFTQLGWFAGATSRIRLATGVVNVFSRSPALIAQSAATIDRMSNGRFILGLGTSGPQVVSGWHGVPFEQPIQRLRETVEIVRMALARKRLVYNGRVFSLNGGMELGHEPVRSWVPIYLATLSPLALRLTGEIADGWLAAFFSPSQYAEIFERDLHMGAASRDREAKPLSVCVYHSVVVSDDKAAGRDAVRPQLAFYIGAAGSRGRNFYNDLFRRYGFIEEADRVQRLYLDKRREEAVRAVTDEMIDRVTIIGPAAECRECLEEMNRIGIDEIALQLTIPEGTPGAMLAALESLAPR